MDLNMPMDVNELALKGRLAAAPDYRVLESGSRMARLLVAVRSEEPHSRLDVLPVVWWAPEDEFVAAPPEVGSRVWITGSVQRRYWESADGRRSKLEVVAAHVSAISEGCQMPESAARLEH
jgi:single-stranded DNA-binding protein